MCSSDSTQLFLSVVSVVSWEGGRFVSDQVDDFVGIRTQPLSQLYDLRRFCLPGDDAQNLPLHRLEKLPQLVALDDLVDAAISLRAMVLALRVLPAAVFVFGDDDSCRPFTISRRFRSGGAKGRKFSVRCALPRQPSDQCSPCRPLPEKFSPEDSGGKIGGKILGYDG